MRNTVLVLCLMSLVLGCGREGSPAAAKAVTVTNVVEVTREVVVTNVVTVVTTNAVEVKRETGRLLTARKTAPYVVSVKDLRAVQLRKILSDAAARIITCDPGAVALVEASDKTVGALRGLVNVEPLQPEEKIAADAGADVRISPLSSIDSATVAQAVRELGGEIVQVVTVGRPVVRAKMSYAMIRKLAERGDVRRIERDEK